jgi:hypothetical protein
MANSEHLAILEQGVEAWNQWRAENPEVLPNLSSGDLTKRNLGSINLSGAYLRGVVFTGTDFTLADLSMADLQEADLCETNLTAADFRGTNLNKADLSGSNLYASDFGFSDLVGTKFDGTSFGLTHIVSVDLSKTIGLENIDHVSPSSIGIDTLYKSQGKIPEVFLRGCGVPDQMIEYAKSLTATPTDYYSCFISYSNKDEDFAHRLHADLQANNFRCWYAPHDLKIGDKIRPVIDESIRVHDKLLLILSEHSVQSDWVEHEAEHALGLETERKKGVLFPIRLDAAVMDSKTGWAANVKRQRHIGDFTQWKDHDAYKTAFDRLLRDLKAC